MSQTGRSNTDLSREFVKLCEKIKEAEGKPLQGENKLSHEWNEFLAKASPDALIQVMTPDDAKSHPGLFFMAAEYLPENYLNALIHILLQSKKATKVLMMH